MVAKTGFLPEPIPTIEMDEAVVNDKARRIKEIVGGSTPNLRSPLFADLKKVAFRRLTEGLSVEQTMARFPEVFNGGIDSANIRISLEDVRGLAKEIGESATKGIVTEALDDTRLFRRWVKSVIKKIADKHFQEDFDVYLDVAHLDVPGQPGEDDSIIVMHGAAIYNEDEEDYFEKTFTVNTEWFGRQVIRAAWIDYIVYLMRVICALSV